MLGRRCTGSQEVALSGQLTWTDLMYILYNRESWPIYKLGGSWLGGTNCCLGTDWASVMMSNYIVHNRFFLDFIILKIKIIIIISILIFYLVPIVKILLSSCEAFPESPPHSTGVEGDKEWTNSCLVLSWVKLWKKTLNIVWWLTATTLKKVRIKSLLIHQYLLPEWGKVETFA